MRSHAPVDYECPMCLVVAGDASARVNQDHVVERTPDTITFISPKWWPGNPGAALVVPRQHVENLYDLPDELGGPLMRASRRAATAMTLAYSCAGTSTRQHNEPAGNQDVWHFHIHVFPRYPEDDLYGSRGTWVDPAAMRKKAVLLRSGFDLLDA